MEKYANTILAVNNILEDAHHDSAKKDFESARSNIHRAIETAQLAIEDLAEIARGSQHPRAYEVLGSLIHTAITASKELLQLQIKIREIDVIDAPTNKAANITHNNLFVGSTAELQKVLKEIKNNNGE